MLRSFKIPFSKWYVHTYRWIPKQDPDFESYTLIHDHGVLVEHFVRFGQVQFIITTLPF